MLKEEAAAALEVRVVGVKAEALLLLVVEAVVGGLAGAQQRQQRGTMLEFLETAAVLTVVAALLTSPEDTGPVLMLAVLVENV
jgi:sulfite reductase beta subunit-like hemoprotein